MKVALAQIDMRLGDLEGICSRIEAQVSLAKEQGAKILCTPSPLFGGLMPGSLIASSDYEHDLLHALGDLAERVESSGVTCLVPAAVAYEDAPLFEVFLLKDGKVIPARTVMAMQRGEQCDDLWAPPIFDICGTRVAVTFDAERDIPKLPTGCDLVVFFQVNAFDMTSSITTSVAAVGDGRFRDLVGNKSVWLACMSPVGAYDEATYTGGSFFMDDAGRVVSMAPSFEESLLVQDVQRGVTMPCVPDYALPRFNREEWLWQTLVLSLRDTAAAQGTTRAVVRLDGDLATSLTAALCVDAFGSRNVLGLIVTRETASTAAQDEAEQRRLRLARTVALNLRVRTVEREGLHSLVPLRADLAVPARSDLWQRVAGLYLSEIAEGFEALAVSSLTKTAAALAAPSYDGAYLGDIAPFADVYLTELEFVARVRNRASAVVPSSLVTLASVGATMDGLLGRAVAGLGELPDYGERALQALGGLEPGQVDAALEAHVDRNATFAEIPLASSRPQAVSLLLLLVRQGERARRSLPLTPIVSARSFAERAWPQMLAWSDRGHADEDAVTLSGLARAEIERFESHGAEAGERMRNEIMGLLGGLMGITPEQMDELRSDEGQRRIRENLKKFEDQVQDAIGKMIGDAGDDGEDGPAMPFGPSGSMSPQGDSSGQTPHPFTFFSDN